MKLPLLPPFPVAEARSVETVPAGKEWVYEPKWDGFRCLAFRDGAEVYMQSKANKPLARYFPDIVAALAALAAKLFVVDGELLIPIDGELSFEELQLRLHPAASRVAKLAAEHPALYVIFDLLVDERGRSLVEQPQRARRAGLEEFARRYISNDGLLRLSPETRSQAEARGWLGKAGSGLDGVIAKRADLDYRSGTREGMVKVKNIRTADCVVGGFRYATGSRQIGSLLLGLYDRRGLLDHVGFTATIARSEQPALTARLERLAKKKASPIGFTGRSPGGPSRWSAERSGEYVALPHELVVEVTYDHFTGGRFRHGTRLVRWRPDKSPQQCRLEDVARRGRVTLPLFAGA